MMRFRNKFTPFGSMEAFRPNGDLSTHPDGIRLRRTGLDQKQPGFTLIEVLLALAIIGMVLTPIFMIQQMVLRRSSSSAQLFSRLIQAKDFLIDQQFENMQETKEVTAEKKITNPITALTFNSRKVPENSALKKFKHIMIDSVTMQWTEQNKKRQEKLVTFSFKPEEKR